jgi:hypothetical protein
MSKSEDKNEYRELAYETAVAVSKLENVKRRCEWLDGAYNVDPEIDLDEMLLEGARALSSLVICAKEIEDKFGKIKKEKNND